MGAVNFAVSVHSYSRLQRWRRIRIRRGTLVSVLVVWFVVLFGGGIISWDSAWLKHLGFPRPKKLAIDARAQRYIDQRQGVVDARALRVRSGGLPFWNNDDTELAQEVVDILRREVTAGRLWLTVPAVGSPPLFAEGGDAFVVSEVESAGNYFPFILFPPKYASIGETRQSVEVDYGREPVRSPMWRAQGWSLEEARPILSTYRALVHYRQWQAGRYPLEPLNNRCPELEEIRLLFRAKVEAAVLTCTLERQLLVDHQSSEICRQYRKNKYPNQLLGLEMYYRHIFMEAWPWGGATEKHASSWLSVE